MKKLGLLLVTVFAMFLLFGCAKGTTTDAFRFEAREIEVLVGEEKDIALILGETSSKGTIIYHYEAIDDSGESLIPANRILSMNGVNSTYYYRDTTSGKDEVLMVKGLQPGSVKITAYVKEEPNYVDSIIVNVVHEKLNAFQIVTDKDTIRVGEELWIETKVFPQTLKNDAIFSSSDEEILKVYSNGMVKALKPGTATIYASSIYDESIVAKKEITVKQVSLNGISTPSDTLSLFIGAERQIEVIYDPYKPSTDTRYQISDESIATVDENGVVKGLSDGEATVTISAGSKQTTLTIKVNGIVENKLEFDEGTEFELNMGTNTTQELYYEVLPEKASQNLTAEIADPTICEVVARDGILTIKALNTGETTIRVYTKTKLYYQDIRVSVVISPGDLVTEVKVTGKASMNVNDEQTLKLTVNPAKAYDKTVTWTSSDEAIATVNDEGLVTAISAGTVTITATANDGSAVSGSFEITVTDEVAD